MSFVCWLQCEKFQWLLTSFSNPPIVESVRVRDKIFRSGFLSAVIQLAHVFGNDVIEALAFDIIMTSLKTVK